MADVGEVALDVAGLRAVVVVDVDVVGFGLAAAEEVVLDMAEVRLAAVPRVELRRLSSSETDDVERWVEEGAAVDERLVAVELAAGRVGGLLSPPVAVPVRAVEEAAGFVAVDDVAGRRAAVVVVAGFFAAPATPVLVAVVAGFLTGAAVDEALGFSAGGSAGGASAAGASEAASSCWTTSYPSASDILASSLRSEGLVAEVGGACLRVRVKR